MIPETLSTERLVLRRFREEDLDALHAIHSQPEVARYLYWESRSEADVRRVLEKKLARHAMVSDGETLDFAAELVATGEMVADMTLILVSADHRQGELGFIVPPEHQGHGYAVEAAKPLLALAFEALGLHRVRGRLDARNEASARVLERIGMRQEAHLVENEWVKGEWQSERVYALRGAPWRTARAHERLQG